MKTELILKYQKITTSLYDDKLNKMPSLLKYDILQTEC